MTRAHAPSKASGPIGIGLVLAGLGLFVLVLLACLPANWLAHAVARQTEGRLVLADARGTIWSGNAVPVLVNGSARLTLPGRLQWRIEWAGWNALGVRLTNPAVLKRPVVVTLAADELRVTPGEASMPLAWPVTLAIIAGAPLNSLDVSGQANMRWDTLTLHLARRAGHSDAERTRIQLITGQGELLVDDLSVAVTPVRPLGDYRLNWVASAQSLSWTLATLSGVLSIEGRGSYVLPGGVRFEGRAAPTEDASAAQVQQLRALLDMLGRRDGTGVLLRFGGASPQAGASVPSGLSAIRRFITHDVEASDA